MFEPCPAGLLPADPEGEEFSLEDLGALTPDASQYLMDDEYRQPQYGPEVRRCGSRV